MHFVMDYLYIVSYVGRYYCRTGAISATPDESPDAAICPAGYYCPAGTTEPTACPTGKFSAATGRSNLAECLDCTAGIYTILQIIGSMKQTLSRERMNLR